MILAEYLYLMIMVPEVIWFDRTDGANAKNGGGENSEIVMKPNRTDVENEIEGLLCFEAGIETVSKSKRLALPCKYHLFRNDFQNSSTSRLVLPDPFIPRKS